MFLVAQAKLSKNRYNGCFCTRTRSNLSRIAPYFFVGGVGMV